MMLPADAIKKIIGPNADYLGFRLGLYESIALFYRNPEAAAP